MDASDTLIANQPIVIDNGSGVLKAGFAGDQVPKLVFPNIIGDIKHQRVMTGGLEGHTFIGPNAEENRGLLRLRYPMEHGIVTDWDDIEKVWSYVYSKNQLNAASEEHPVLLTEAPLNPWATREKTAEIFFETFNVPAMFMSMQAVLSLYASGKTTGLVLDCGDGVAHAVPICQGFAINHAIQRNDLAGRDITRYLRLLLRQDGYIFRTSAEFEIVRCIKEVVKTTSPNLSELAMGTGLALPTGYLGRVCMVNNARTVTGDLDHGGIPDKVSYTLPDGNSIELASSRFMAPEILFRPDIIGEECVGVHNLVHNAIKIADMDLRKILFTNIVLSGGSTLFRGFGDRLLMELRKKVSIDTKIKISAPRERLYSTWIGGSILASLDTFKKMWITKKEWENDGPKIIRKRTM